MDFIQITGLIIFVPGYIFGIYKFFIKEDYMNSQGIPKVTGFGTLLLNVLFAVFILILGFWVIWIMGCLEIIDRVAELSKK